MAMARTSGRAGGAARDRYERGLRAWRQTRGVRVMTLLAWSVIGGSLGFAYLVPSLSSAMSAVVGGTFVTLLWVRRAAPEYVERWERGAEGERRTARVLESLGSRWTVRHDIPTRYGNYDHVVVGPGGVFLVDSKNLGGTASVGAGGLTIRRRLLDSSYDTYPGKGTRVAAASLKKHIQRASGVRCWVQPVVAIWGSFPENVAEADGVAYVAGEHLVKWLEGRRPTLSGQRREALAAALGTLQTD